MERKEILRARAIVRDTLFGKLDTHKNKNKTTFNIIYHPVFCNARKN